jgi:putative chitinase
MISLQQLAACIGCTQMTAASWYAPLTLAMAEFGIDSTLRVAAFLAQVGHESQSLHKLTEDLNYSAQAMMKAWPKRFPTLQSCAFYEHSPERLANFVYANRYGNGGFESGDGFRYSGKGPIQITFADNYRRCGQALNLPLIEKPELLLEPKAGARSAGWFWSMRGCNEPADVRDIDQVSERINGGPNGLDLRRLRYQQALKALA